MARRAQIVCRKRDNAFYFPSFLGVESFAGADSFGLEAVSVFFSLDDEEEEEEEEEESQGVVEAFDGLDL